MLSFGYGGKNHGPGSRIQTKTRKREKETHGDDRLHPEKGRENKMMSRRDRASVHLAVSGDPVMTTSPSASPEYIPLSCLTRCSFKNRACWWGRRIAEVAVFFFFFFYFSHSSPLIFKGNPTK